MLYRNEQLSWELHLVPNFLKMKAEATITLVGTECNFLWHFVIKRRCIEQVDRASLCIWNNRD